jgi:circadian clock protein KaiC
MVGPVVRLPNTELAGMIDNTLFLRHVELHSQLYRLISIVNVREGDFDPAIREFRITNNGIEVANTFASAEAILTGVARPQPPAATGRSRRRGGHQELGDADHSSR